MARTKEINGLIVGYNYILKKFYVTNKGYTTYRVNIDDILKVIEIAGVGSMSGVREQVERLKNNYEELSEISYTLSETGSYISSITFNNYTDYCIVLDLYKGKIFINNSNIVLDLSLNESLESHAKVLWEYYREHVGIQIDYKTILNIYDELILSYYKSDNINSIYNFLEKRTDNSGEEELYYSDTIGNNNFDKQGLAEYTVKLNPDNTYTLTYLTDIVKTDTNNNSITLLGSIPDTLSIGDKVNIQGSETVNSNYTYSSDGTYTIKELNTIDNEIIVEESIKSNYNFQFKTLYLQISPLVISTIRRDTSTITLTTQIPNNYEVGNIIHIRGTQQFVEGQQVTCDGQYTIASINSDTNTIQVQEVVPTNFTNTDSLLTCTLSKQEIISTVSSVKDKIITLYNNISITVPQDSKVVFDNTVYTVVNITDNTVEVQEDIPEYTSDIAVLNSVIPDTYMLITVSNTTNETVFPITTFMLDNFTDLQEYIGLLKGLPIPSVDTYNRINTPVEQYLTLNNPITIYNVYGEILGYIDKIKFIGLLNPSQQ